MKNKLISSIVSCLITVCIVIPSVSFAYTTLRDPNGDRWITPADSSFINSFLNGSLTPTNLTPLDFDQNGIISAMDSYKVQLVDAGFTNVVPDANANDPSITANTESL